MRRHALALVALIVASGALIGWLVFGSDSTSRSAGENSVAHGEARTAPATDSEVEPVLDLLEADRDEVDADTFDDLRPPTERELQARALSFEIEVVDSEGRPAPGVRLSLATDQPLAEHVGWNGTSDRNGRARVSRAFDRQRLRTEQLILAPTLARTMPVDVRFSVTAPPSSPVRFQLEPTGSIELVALRRDGAPLDEDVQVILRASRSLDPARPTPRVSVRERLQAKAGRLLVEQVGLDLEFSIFTRSPRFEFARLEFLGPRHPGERVRVEPRVKRVQAQCRGRVLDTEGRPLRGVSVTGRRGAQRQSDIGFIGSVWFVAVTDAEGVFNAFGQSAPGDDQVEFRVTRAGRAPSRAVLSVPSPVLNTADEPVLDFGDVQLTPDPLFASGRVVDTGGEAVSGVAIQLRAEEDSEWRFPHISTDARGRFEIPMRVCSAAATLRAFRHRACVGPEVRVDPGAQDIELSIAAVGSIEGEFDAPEELLKASVEVSVWPSGSAESPETMHFQSGGSIGRFFFFSGLTAGNWNLSARHHGRLLFERQLIPVRPHEVTFVGVIKLSAEFFVLNLQVQSATGAELSEGRVQFFDDLGQEHTDVFHRDGKARIESSTPTRSVLVRASGHQAVYLPNASDGARVTLAPQCERQFAWPAHVAPFLEEREVLIQFSYAGPAWVVQACGEVRIRGGFESAVSAKLNLAGRYDVTVSVLDPDNGKPSEISPPGATIVIDEQPSNFPLDLPVDPDRLERYLRKNP